MIKENYNQRRQRCAHLKRTLPNYVKELEGGQDGYRDTSYRDRRLRRDRKIKDGFH